MSTSLPTGPAATEVAASSRRSEAPASRAQTGAPPSRPRSEAPTSRAEQILARVRATPPGFVRTYGDVSPGAPRWAGAVLHACEDPEVPWHRIVRADGSLAKGERQRLMLEAEDVPFRGSRVEMRLARMPDVEGQPTRLSRSGAPARRAGR